MSVDLPASDTKVAVSIVVPVRNEADNVAPLVKEIAGALDGRWAYEIIYVNDGSTDATGERLLELMKRHPQLRQLRHANSSGQSAAVRSGVRAARGAIVATLDGDGQNNPAFLPELICSGREGRRPHWPCRRPAGRTQGYRFQAMAVAHRQRRPQRHPA